LIFNFLQKSPISISYFIFSFSFMQNHRFFGFALLCVLFLFGASPSSNNLFAQPCGSKVSEADAAFMRGYRTPMRSFGIGETRGIRDFPIQAHVVTKLNGTGGVDLKLVKEAINNLNNYYFNANVRFVLLDEVKYIKNPNWYEFDTNEEEAMCSANDVKGVINMYFCGAVTMQGTELCGYAYFPNSQSNLMKKDRVIMQNTCVDDACTLPHEMGHFFSLYHTHGKSNFGSTDEFVNGQNCGIAGDEMCDTPADPMVFGKINNDCRYTGSDRDKNGQAFNPPTTNMMSYSNNQCLREFSAQQYARINYAAFNLRNYLQFPNRAPTNAPSTATTNTPIAEARSRKLSGELELKIEQQAVPVTLDGNLYKGSKKYYSGTSYQVTVKNGEPAYVYVIGSDLTTATSTLYPLDGKSSYLDKKDQKILLPSAGDRYTMDETKGKDFLCVLYSREELNIEQVREQMQQQKGTFMQRLYKVLGQQVVPSNQILYAANGKMSFNANTYAQQNIVPIVIELIHL
jgi:Domain of unknown function (DUF4384)/Pregnancy-associated plasma protein-A